VNSPKTVSPATHLIIKGAREHNLKNVDLTIPKNQLVVFTGVSGSGKSSMAHDTIYAEGQRRYVESLSSYARQFLGVMDKPDVDRIDGLSPAIMIDQKQGSHNPRSTVGTVTEIYDYLRLLYARIGHYHCPNCNREVKPQDIIQIRDQVWQLSQQHPNTNKHKGCWVMVMSPIVKNKKGEFRDLFPNLLKKGITQCRVDDKFFDNSKTINLFKNNRHNIDAVIDKLVIPLDDNRIDISPVKNRLVDSIETAISLSGGEVVIAIVLDAALSFPDSPTQLETHLFSQNLSCPICNISLPQFEPRSFSFNSPDGACLGCSGLGSKLTVNPDTLIAPNLTLKEGGIIPLSSQFETLTWFARLIRQVMQEADFADNTPLKFLTEKQHAILMHGTNAKVHTVRGTNSKGNPAKWHTQFSGLIGELERRFNESSSDYVRHELERYMIKKICPLCHGARLKKEILAVTIADKSIADVCHLSIDSAVEFFSKLNLVLNTMEKSISSPITKEIQDRLSFLQSVGLDYLTLDREAGSLSGGELQRIRLASQIGSRLTGILYVLDEPTIGLHQVDNQKLINTLKNLVTLGNTLVVVEHDRDAILSADHLVEFGPLAGNSGGAITFQGSVDQILNSTSLTGQYLSGKKSIGKKYPPRQSIGRIALENCTHHNLKSIDLEIPLGLLIGVTGVSGSGKSSLIVDTLYEALAQKINPDHRERNIPFGRVTIPDIIKRVSLIDQSPIGRTPRSNPATYTKIFDYVRKIYSQTKEAHLRGYNQGRFSFNVKGGRCETCEGDGVIKIEMQFMGDIYVTCETCQGRRYNEPTLDIDYKGKNIAEVLEMTVKDAYDFFDVPILKNKLDTLRKVGLDYIKLGQQATTLSGGEAQRIKLASELSKTNSGHTVYILDEPTTGLHFHDLNNLLATLQALVDNDNTVIVIEHNLDLIKNVDYILDIGPGGGDNGGQIIASGSIDQIISKFQTPTSIELRRFLGGR